MEAVENGRPEIIIEIYRDEIEELQLNRSTIQVYARYKGVVLVYMCQNASRAVLARENCLKKIREIAEKCISGDSLNSEELENATELLTHLRFLSVNAVECIVKWREKLQRITYLAKNMEKSAFIPFWFYGVNYLLKVNISLKYYS
mgnify:FL=1